MIIVTKKFDDERKERREIPADAVYSVHSVGHYFLLNSTDGKYMYIAIYRIFLLSFSATVCLLYASYHRIEGIER